MGRPGEQASAVVADFISALGMPRNLREVGIDESMFGKVADASLLDYCLYTNPRKVNGVPDILEILKLAA